MIPMQITYTEYQRVEQPIADFITHLLLMIKKIASPFVLEYRQWGDYDNANGLSAITYPISLTNKPFVIITTEGDPAGWDNNINGIAIAGADIVTASNTQANILSKWIISGGAIKRQGQNVRVVIVGI